VLLVFEFTSFSQHRSGNHHYRSHFIRKKLRYTEMHQEGWFRRIRSKAAVTNSASTQLPLKLNGLRSSVQSGDEDSGVGDSEWQNALREDGIRVSRAKGLRHLLLTEGFVLLNCLCWNLTFHVMGLGHGAFGNGVGYEVEPSWVVSVSLSKRPQKTPSPLLACEVQWEGATWTGPFPGTNSAGASVSDFPAFELWEMHFCCL
jgi:hypothetical protein